MNGASFGGELRRLRRERRWTQEDLAFHAGIDQTSVSQYERGKHLPTMEIVGRLARAFGMTTEDLARLAGHLPPAPPEAPTGDVFDRAPLARLVSAVEALPGMADQLDQLDALSPGKQEEMIRRLARRFAFEISEELLAAESDKLAHSEK